MVTRFGVPRHAHRAFSWVKSNGADASFAYPIQVGWEQSGQLFLTVALTPRMVDFSLRPLLAGREVRLAFVGAILQFDVG